MRPASTTSATRPTAASSASLFDAPARAGGVGGASGRHPHPRRGGGYCRCAGAVRRHRRSSIASRRPVCSTPLLERGYYVSFAGNVTYPKAVDLREAAAAVPDDRILAETDSPYLAPQPVRGKRNEPANVLHTLAVLAEVRGDEVAALERQIDLNAEAAFGLACRRERRAEEVPRPALPRRRQHPRRHRPPGRARPGRRRSRDRARPRRPHPRARRAVRLRPRRRARPPARAAPRGPRRTRRTSPSTGEMRSGSTSRASSRAPTKLVANLPYNVATPDRGREPRWRCRRSASGA